MQYDPYIILGVGRDATQSEITDAYRLLKTKYENDRFLEGEAGYEAAKKLGEIEYAYEEIMRLKKQGDSITDSSDGLMEIRQAIIDKDYKKAQDLLDAYTVRSAEWHYLQAKVFYDKKWFSEAVKQLKIALEMEPDNQRYKGAYDRIIEESKADFAFGNATQGGGRSYRGMSGSGDTADTCCKMCQIYLCLDCCCSSADCCC